MTCAKRRVRCEIVTNTGAIFESTNWCDKPQKTCPRLPGENYDKCKSICHQQAHAEINALNALKLNGFTANEAKAYVYGIDYVCKECSRALFEAGIKEIRIMG
jgi:deoxycytidylate deaminase